MKKQEYKVWLINCHEVTRALDMEEIFWLWLSTGYWKRQFLEGREPDVAALDVLPF